MVYEQNFWRRTIYTAIFPDNSRKEKKMKKLANVLKAIGNEIMFLLTGKGEIADDMIKNGLISYDGQGRDEFGK